LAALALHKGDKRLLVCGGHDGGVAAATAASSAGTLLQSLAKIFHTAVCVSGAMAMAFFKGPKLLLGDLQDALLLLHSPAASGSRWVAGVLFWEWIGCWARDRVNFGSLLYAGQHANEKKRLSLLVGLELL
jgi:hypothetical protein